MPKPTSDPDAGATAGLSEAVRSVMPALEEFLEFRDEDRAAGEFTRWRSALDEPLPAEGNGAESTLEVLAETVIPRGLRTGAPGFAGWVTTMPTVVPAVAAFSASLAGAQRWWIQPFNFLEHLALQWLRVLLGLPAAFQGTFNSGGSVANLIALAAARQWACEQRGFDPSQEGLGALEKPRLYVTGEVHHVVNRAAAVLGLGRKSLEEVPADNNLRMDPEELRNRIRRDKADGCVPVAAVATAGTVNTGAVDPIGEILQVCREEEVWLHVDGAYGGFGVLDPEVAPLYGDMGEVDSLAVDPHKWLAVPLGCGATFVRERGLLGRALTLEPAEYLEGSVPAPRESPDSQFEGLGYPFHDFNLEQSARSRGATVWAALHEIGEEGLRGRIIRHNGFARELARLVKASPVLELLAPVTLSICCFRYVPDALGENDGVNGQLNNLNREILSRLHREHRYIPSGTEIDGRFAIRPCYINPRTTIGEVEGLAAAVERIGAQTWSDRIGGGG